MPDLQAIYATFLGVSDLADAATPQSLPFDGVTKLASDGLASIAKARRIALRQIELNGKAGQIEPQGFVFLTDAVVS